MLKGTASRLLKATSQAHTSGRLLKTNFKLMQPNNTFNSILKGKSTLSRPVPHISVTCLDYFENEAFQIEQQATSSRSKLFDEFALKYAVQHVKSKPQITTDGIDPVAKIEHCKTDVEEVVEIIIEAEVSNTRLPKVDYVKTIPQNYTRFHQIDQIGQGKTDCNTTANKREITLKNAYVNTLSQNSTDKKYLESKAGQDNKKNNKIELFNANDSLIRMVLIDKLCQDNMNTNKTADSERKAAVFNASLVKDTYASITPINSYKTGPKLKIKQHDKNRLKPVDSKRLVEIFNAAHLKEIYAYKCMLQNPSNTKDSVSEIDKITDSETKAAIFNTILLKDAALKSMPLNIKKDPMKSMPQKDICPFDKTEQLKKSGKERNKNKSLAVVFNSSAHKDTYIVSVPDSYKTEPIADSELRKMNCAKAVVNNIKTNSNIGEVYVKNVPQNSKNSKGTAANIKSSDKVVPIMTFVSNSFLVK